jgi:hypothetical protein
MLKPIGDSDKERDRFISNALIFGQLTPIGIHQMPALIAAPGQYV